LNCRRRWKSGVRGLKGQGRGDGGAKKEGRDLQGGKTLVELGDLGTEL